MGKMAKSRDSVYIRNCILFFQFVKFKKKTGQSIQKNIELPHKKQFNCYLVWNLYGALDLTFSMVGLSEANDLYFLVLKRLKQLIFIST